MEKHGLSFEEASHIFERDVLTWIDKERGFNDIRKYDKSDSGIIEFLLLSVEIIRKRGKSA